MRLRACAALSVNGSSTTIHHKPKFVGFFARAWREFCTLCRKVSSCLRTTCLLLAFFVIFQYGLINVCWARTETMVRLTFKENWFTVHLVRIVCNPHNVIKVCSVCQALYYVHTPASLLLSKACVIVQAVMRVTHVLLHAWLELFLHSLKASVIAQAGTQLMSTFVHFCFHQRDMLQHKWWHKWRICQWNRTRLMNIMQECEQVLLVSKACVFMKVERKEEK